MPIPTSPTSPTSSPTPDCSPALSEKQKMLSGALYDASDAELQRDAAATQAWLARYNTAPGEIAEAALLEEDFAAQTGARYPVEWRVASPAGEHTVRARLDAQELDARASTGNIYWEGLSRLLDARGQQVGQGYLEMTGYAQRLRL